MIAAILDRVPGNHLTFQEMAVMFPQSRNALYSLIKRALAQGDLIQIRRGLYCIHPRYRKKTLNTLALSPIIYGPSYISLETALSLHGLIPEAVRQITAVSLKKSSRFETALGHYIYSPVPQKILFEGVERISDESGTYFLATPFKAILDTLYIRDKKWRSLKDLSEDLRIEPDQVLEIFQQADPDLPDNYSSPCIKTFCHRIQKEIGT
jgi:hypothetical protein